MSKSLDIVEYFASLRWINDSNSLRVSPLSLLWSLWYEGSFNFSFTTSSTFLFGTLNSFISCGVSSIPILSKKVKVIVDPKSSFKSQGALSGDGADGAITPSETRAFCGTTFTPTGLEPIDYTWYVVKKKSNS